MNTEYKKLAYERAVLMTLVRVAQERYLPITGADEPEVKIECEDLPRNESEVPEDAIIEVVLRLRNLAVNREMLMGKFKFVNTEASDEQEWEEAGKSQGSEAQLGAKGPEGEGESSEAHSKAAAVQGGGRKPSNPRAKKAVRAKSSRS
jgi:hypothetical protein